MTEETRSEALQRVLQTVDEFVSDGEDPYVLAGQIASIIQEMIHSAETGAYRYNFNMGRDFHTGAFTINVEVQTVQSKEDAKKWAESRGASVTS